VTNENVGDVVTTSFSSLYDQVVHFFPILIVAILVLVFGWAIAILLGRLVGKALAMIKVDDLADKLGLGQLSERVGRKLSISGFGNWLIKWFFIVAVFIAATDILGLHQVSEFLFQDVVPYFANVVVAAAVLVIGIIAANFISGVVSHSLKASHLGNFEAVASLVRWAVLIFALLAALSQLRVATSFINDLFRAIVAMLAIAGGIAFGLGGKDHARQALDHITKKLGQ